MQIQIGLALGIFKDPQTKKLFNHFIGNFPGVCLSHTDQHQKAFADAAGYLTLPLHAVPAVLQIASVYFSPTFFSS